MRREDVMERYELRAELSDDYGCYGQTLANASTEDKMWEKFDEFYAKHMAHKAEEAGTDSIWVKVSCDTYEYNDLTDDYEYEDTEEVREYIATPEELLAACKDTKALRENVEGSLY